MEAPLHAQYPRLPGDPATVYQTPPCGSGSISPLTLVPPCQPRNGESTQRPWAQCCEHRLRSNSKADRAVRTPTDSGSPKATALHTQFLPDVQAGVSESRIHPSLPSQGQPPLPPTPSPGAPLNRAQLGISPKKTSPPSATCPRVVIVTYSMNDLGINATLPAQADRR